MPSNLDDDFVSEQIDEDQLDIPERVLYAAGRGETERIVELLKEDPHAADGRAGSMTPLMVASASGKLDCVNMLMERGVNVRMVDSIGQTALHHAAKREQAECLAALIPASDIDAKNEFGNTALLLAAEGAPRCVEILLRHGADPMVSGEHQLMPLHLAALSNRAEVVKTLLGHCDSSAVDAMKQSALHIAAMNGHADCVALLLAESARRGRDDAREADQNGDTPLIHAAWRGDAKTIGLLLPHSDINALNKDGQSATDVARAQRNFKASDQIDAYRCDLEAAQIAAATKAPPSRNESAGAAHRTRSRSL